VDGATEVETFAVRSAWIAGRGRGKGMSRKGGVAAASPAKTPRALNPRMSRIAVTGTDLSAATRPRKSFSDGKIEDLPAPARGLGNRPISRQKRGIVAALSSIRGLSA
jgi:hypothetical protein